MYVNNWANSTTLSFDKSKWEPISVPVKGSLTSQQK